MKPPLVFLSPVIPSFSGNGLAMRAAHNLQALAGEFSVHLLVIAMYGGHEGMPELKVLELCTSWKRIDASLPPETKSPWSFRNWLRWGTGVLPREWSGWTAKNGSEAMVFLERTRCVRVWVFRFYLLPWAKAWMDRGGKAWLDLDELESGARQTQAELYRCADHQDEYRSVAGSARSYRDLERKFLRRFERIVTASELETARLRGMGATNIEAWPNVISTEDVTQNYTLVSRNGLRLLFIGSLGHFPNRDAIHFAAREVLPELQRLVGKAVLAVAGAGADAHRAEFAGLDNIEWLGTVPDVSEAYAGADIAIVPLRAGGGTRIKILEAFAHRKAVVSTTVGAEGLNVVHGRELLLANDPKEIAACCAELFRGAEKREKLAAAGHAFVMAHHTDENLKPLAAALTLQKSDWE